MLQPSRPTPPPQEKHERKNGTLKGDIWNTPTGQVNRKYEPLFVDIWTIPNKPPITGHHTFIIIHEIYSAIAC